MNMSFSPLSALRSLLLVGLLSFLTNAQEAATTEATATTATATTEATVYKTFKIFHSLGQNKPFVPRGTIKFTSSDETDDDNKNESESGELVTVVENDESCLGEKAMVDMDELISNDGYYRIKIVEEGENGSKVGGVLASVPACEVKRANFREEISLSMSPTGSIQSISYKPLVSPLAALCHELQPLSSSNKEYTFTTLLSYTTSTPGMTLPKILPKMRPPPGLTTIPRSPNSNKNNNNGNSQSSSSSQSDNNDNNNNQQQNHRHGFHAEEDEEKMKENMNQSFLRKYWYIILPATIMTFIGGEDPAGQQQQQGAGAAAGAAAAVGGATAAVAASAGAGAGTGATKQRRGKRNKV